jgi:hypothetical protein
LQARVAFSGGLRDIDEYRNIKELELTGELKVENKNPDDIMHAILKNKVCLFVCFFFLIFGRFIYYYTYNFFRSLNR